MFSRTGGYHDWLELCIWFGDEYLWALWIWLELVDAIIIRKDYRVLMMNMKRSYKIDTMN